VPARRKLIADIRPQGATRFMTVQILLFDAAVLGVLACLLGLALGELLSIAVFHATPGYLSFTFPVGNERIVTWQSVALAVAAGFAAAVAGVLWPLRDILGQPLEGERPATAGHHWTIHARLAVGLLCLLITTLILVVHPQSGFVGIITLVLALVCLLPPLFDGLVALFDHTQRALDGAATVLAVTELQTRATRVRSLAIAATAAVAIFGIVEFQGTQSNLTSGLDASARQLDASADVWVTPSGASNAFATTPFNNLRSGSLAHLPGVRTLGLYRGGFLNWGDRRLWILAPPRTIAQPIPASQVVSGNVGRASAEIRHGGWAVLSEALASQQHLRIGQSFVLPAPRPTLLRVAALISNLGWPPGAIIMNSSDYARAWESGDPSAYVIRAQPRTSPAGLRRLIQRRLGPETGLTVETSAERERRHYALASQGLSRLTQIRLLVLIAAVLASTGAMGAMIWQRRDLVAFIKCQGYRKDVLWRWLLCESAVLLVAGCSIGAVFGLFAQLLGSHFLASVTGFPVVFAIEPIAAISSFALLSIVAITVVALPGYLVVRVPPRTASPAF
jgi:putative ABC transport system permease protein